MTFITKAQNSCATAGSINTAGLYIVGTINGIAPTLLCYSNEALTATTPYGEWFAYTPSQSYTVTITTDISQNTPRVNTRFHVYKGSCSTLNCLSANDDISQSNFSSEATFNVTANTTYYIVFDNRWSATSFSFQLLENTLVIPTSPVTFSSQVILNSNFPIEVSQITYKNGVVDMNGDYLDDLLGVTGSAIRIHYQNTDGTFSYTDYPTETTANIPSWSIAAGDFNKDGFNDLMYGSSNGVTFAKSNSTDTGYSLTIPPQSVLCQRVNFVELNNDGNLDAFSCHDVAPNVYFANDGTNNMTYFQSGVSPGAANMGIYPSGGNYGSIFVDYDNDGDSDLFIAKCRGSLTPANLNELHRNDSYVDTNGNHIISFTDVSVAANLSDPIQSWSSGWADFDNDGDMDVFVTANSSSIGGFHKLMNNNGDGTFTNITVGSGLDTYFSTSNNFITHDFDNNGFVDIMGGFSTTNSILFNQGNGTFISSSIGISSGAVGDFNNDGFLDFRSTSGNLNINSGNTNNWIKITLQGIQSNRNGIGARVELYGAWGKQIRDVRSGDGFSFMSSLNVHFGIGQVTQVNQIIIRWPSGIVDTINNPSINQSTHIVEGISLAVENYTNSAFDIYPNPAKNVLNIKVKDEISMTLAQVYDLNGKLIFEENTNLSSPINIEKLETGTYILLIRDSNNKDYSQKFVKE